MKLIKFINFSFNRTSIMSDPGNETPERAGASTVSAKSTVSQKSD